jgi:minimal PKS acyl carrier protein
MNESTLLAALVAGLEAVGVDGAAAVLAERPGVTFADLDVDSLGVIEIAARIEDECGIAVPDADLDDLDSPAAVLDHLLAVAAPVELAGAS